MSGTLKAVFQGWWVTCCWLALASGAAPSRQFLTVLCRLQLALAADVHCVLREAAGRGSLRRLPYSWLLPFAALTLVLV